jgi:hypothetical protein
VLRTLGGLREHVCCITQVPRSISSASPHSTFVTRAGALSAPGYYEAHSTEAAVFNTLWKQLYAAPHMRYGAMVLGALLAFFLPEEGAAASGDHLPPLPSASCARACS